jgi:hypothetical protein
VPPAAAVAGSMTLWIAGELTVPGGSGAPFINNSAPSHPIAARIPVKTCRDLQDTASGSLLLNGFLPKV